MFLYENDICPVCSKPFEKGDDIVTCPDCGTPHHRECYKDFGGCKNRSLHGTDFVFKRGSSASAVKPEKSFKYSPFLTELPLGEEEKSEYYKPENAESIEDVENNEAEENPADIEEAVSEVVEPQENKEEIDGIQTEDIVSVVAVNTVKFIPKFKRNKLINWNWSAFFFGPYYLFFRKMYVQGMIFMALYYIINLVVSAVFMSAGIAFAKTFKAANDYFEAWKTFSADPEYKNYIMALGIILVSIIVLNTICALIADSLYRKKVFNIIRIVDEKVKMGESFSLMGPIMAIESNMSQKDMRKIFLSRQGGINPWAPFFAMAITNILLRML